MNSDDLIRQFTSTSTDYDKSEWVRITTHLIERLSATLGHELSLERDEPIYGEGFCVDVRSKGVGAEGWELGIRGIVGAQVMGDALLVRAWVFFYLGNMRLSPKPPADFLAMKYVVTEGVGNWEPDGWDIDEHGELDAFAHFDETSRLTPPA